MLSSINIINRAAFVFVLLFSLTELQGQILSGDTIETGLSITYQGPQADSLPINGAGAEPVKVALSNPAFEKWIDKIVAETDEKNQPWIEPLLFALFGGFLSIGGQILISMYQANQKKKDREKVLLAKSKAAIFLIDRTVKDLVMYKTHKQYYRRFYEAWKEEIDAYKARGKSREKEEPYKKEELHEKGELEYLEKMEEDALKKHYEKGQEQRSTEKLLDEQVALYFEMVTEYLILKRKPNSYEPYFDKIRQFEHPKAKAHFKGVSRDKLELTLGQTEKCLYGQYKDGYLDKFDEIQKTLFDYF